MADKMQMWVEVKDKHGKVTHQKMSTSDFALAVKQSHGSGRNDTIQDNIKAFNQNSEGNVAKLIVAVNGKPIGESIERKWLEEVFEKYNDLMEAMAKINVRDDEIKKEWAKVDKAFDAILKIVEKKKYLGESMSLKAKSIVERYKVLKGIKESYCDSCDNSECKCSPEDKPAADEVQPIVDSEETTTEEPAASEPSPENEEEVEAGEPEVLEDAESDEEEEKKDEPVKESFAKSVLEAYKRLKK